MSRPVKTVPGISSSNAAVASSPVRSQRAMLPAPTSTTELPGGAGATVSADAPLRPSTVAVIVTGPGVRPRTSPFASTDATAGSLRVHATARPVSGFPFASFGVAVSCTVPPTTMFAVDGVTSTDATGTTPTPTLAVPVFPSLVALIVAVPWPTPVTRPVASTVATAVLLLAHVTTRPSSGVPFALFGVAVNCTVPPTTMLAVAGVTSTEATAACTTVIAAVPLLPSLVAVSVAVPGATALAMPSWSATTTVSSLDAQRISRPASALPRASSGVAMKTMLVPTSMVAVAGLTSTEATAAGTTVIAAVSLWPSMVPMMSALPAATPATSPVAFTVATPASLDVQVGVLPASTFPSASRAVAVSRVVSPPVSTVPVGGVTSTDATGTVVTVTADVPLLPSLVAVIVTGPPATAVTRPFASTVATAGALLDHVTTRPVSGLPAASSGVAVSCCVAPTRMLALAGVTVTDATSTRVWHVPEPVSVNDTPGMGTKSHV